MRSDLCKAEISDHEKLNVPVLRKTFVKGKLKVCSIVAVEWLIKILSNNHFKTRLYYLTHHLKHFLGYFNQH